jgi:beta-mannosidase
MVARLAFLMEHDDPGRRFVPTSSSGPRFGADEKEFGQGLHWDVHGPWIAAGDLDGDWSRYWGNDDALLRSETGAPGASPVDLIREHLGDCSETPCTLDNPIWRRTPWWIEWPEFLRQGGAEKATLEEYVAWSQARQARALAIAAAACKDRFPRCGGFIVWMGHDSFPCMANTSIIDFHGRPKPAALALGEIFRAELPVRD